MPEGLGARATVVDQYMQIAAQLIAEAAAYAGSTVADEETSGNIRKLRVMTAALNGALMAIVMGGPAPGVTMPPEAFQPAAAAEAPPSGRPTRR